MRETTIQTLTENRVNLDGIGKSLTLLTGSRYVSLAITALELGRMYVGEIALELGKEYPYEKTKKATSPEQIQKAVDLYEGKIKEHNNEIQAIVSIRESIDNINDNTLKTVNEFVLDSPVKGLDKFKIDCNISEAYRSLKEARMWLGKRLGEIRDEN